MTTARVTTAGATQSLLRRAAGIYQDNPHAVSWLRRHLARFDEPLRLAVLGQAEAGKSTVAAALVGRHRKSPEPTGGQAPSWYRTDSLTVLDTPSPDPDRFTRSVQAGCTDADALLYLVPNPYRTSCAILRTAHEHPIAESTPVAALTVLSRADELGAGRIDALITARQIARKYRNEAHVRELSQDATAVCAVVASAAATLNEREFAALAALANAARADVEAALLSADRFIHAEDTLPLAASMRETLLTNFGIFGLRLATALIRQGASSAPELAAQLAQRSGVNELRESIHRHFTERAEALKARAALIGLDVLLRSEPHPGSAGLLVELEGILAGAHEYRELRLLGDLGAGRVFLPDELAIEAARLVGAEGTHPARRLALDAEYGSTDPRYQQPVFAALWRWREHAQNPAFDSAARCAAATVVRSCEEMAEAALPDPSRVRVP